MHMGDKTKATVIFKFFGIKKASVHQCLSR